MSREEKNLSANPIQRTSDTERILLKQYLRKVDARIIPIFIIIYFFAILDKANYAYALVNGLQSHLNLSKINQGHIGAFFFLFYVLAETPSHIILKRIRPSYWFGFIVCCWSLVVISMAFAKKPYHLITSTSLLGLFQSGLTPGVVTYLPYWYTRSEVGARMAILFSSCTLASVLSGPIAAGLGSVGIGSLPSYSTIFFFEGGLTLVVGVLCFFIIQDGPENCTFLNKNEQEFALERVEQKPNTSRTNIPLKTTLKVLSDWKVWVYGIMIMCVNISGTTISFFSPILIKALGVSSTSATLLSALPNLCGFLGQLLTSYTLTVFPLWLNSFVYASISLAGITAYAYTSADRALRLFFLCIFGFGVFPNIPVVATWMSINSGGSSKRIVASAVTISFGGIAGFITPYVNTTYNAPDFTTSLRLNIACSSIIMFFSLVLLSYFHFENKSREKNPRDISHLTQEQVKNLNDYHPGFRYRI